MSLIAFVAENFKMSLTVRQIIAITDFNSVIALIGTDKFEND